MRQPKDQSGFSPEMTLLMALVGRAIGLPTELPPAEAPVPWERLAEKAALHRVLPLLHSGLQAAPVRVPAAFSARLAQDAARLQLRSRILSGELVRVSRLLSGGGVGMAALKGPGLSVQAYGRGVARAMRDLDILIRPADFPQARRLLEAGGFACEASVVSLAPPLQALYLRRATHVSFQHKALGYLLEVHLRPMQVPSLLSLSTETLLAEACLVSFEGGDVPVLSLPHHALYVAAHGAKHGWWRLLWLADFAALQRTLRAPSASSCLPAENSLQRLKPQGLERVLDSAASLCHQCFGAPLPEPRSEPAGWNAQAAWDAQSRRAITAHARRCLERGSPPGTYREKWDELFHLLHLRPEAGYRWDVARLYWDLTPSDLACFPAAPLLPGVLAGLAPALRPLLWGIRRLPRFSRWHRLFKPNQSP